MWLKCYLIWSIYNCRVIQCTKMYHASNSLSWCVNNEYCSAPNGDLYCMYSWSRYSVQVTFHCYVVCGSCLHESEFLRYNYIYAYIYTLFILDAWSHIMLWLFLWPRVGCGCSSCTATLLVCFVLCLLNVKSYHAGKGWMHYFHGNRCVKTNRAIGGLCPDRLMVATFSGFQRWSGKSQQKG